MSTLGDIATTVALKILVRDDAANDWALKAAEQAYRTICNKVPFPELMVRSDELAVTASDPTFNLTTALPDYEIAGIISIRYTVSSTQKYRLIRDDARNHEWYDFTQPGYPRLYSRIDQDTIEFNMAPLSSSHTLRVYFWRKPVIDVSDPASHTLLIPVEWEELLVWETLYRTYHFLQEFDKAHALMLPSMIPPGPSTNKRFAKDMGIIPRLWNDMLKTLNWRESVDEDWGMQPVRRES